MISGDLENFQITIASADPTSGDAKWCFEQYLIELGEHFERDFDPAISVSAYPHELFHTQDFC
jgi:hypothetical protein